MLSSFLRVQSNDIRIRFFPFSFEAKSTFQSAVHSKLMMEKVDFRFIMSMDIFICDFWRILGLRSKHTCTVCRVFRGACPNFFADGNKTSGEILSVKQKVGRKC